MMFVHFNEMNGLSHFQTTSITEDRNGFYWIGTTDGLNRFDGKQFSRYFYQDNNPQSICGNVITNVLERANGEILIGTQMGISRYNTRHNTFTTLFHSEEHVPNQQGIAHILAAQNGCTWVAYRHELYALDTAFQIHQKFDKTTLNGHEIFRLNIDDRQRLWVNTSGKLNYIENNQLYSIKNSFNNPNPIFEIAVADFDIDDDGNLIIAEKTTGNIIVYSSKLELRHSIAPPDNLPIEWIRIFVTPSGKIWFVSADNGIFCLQNDQWIHRGIMHFRGNPASISSSSSVDIFEDSFQNTWFCVDGGLDVLYRNVLPIEHLFEYLGSDNLGNSPLHITSATGDSTTTWITTWGKGLGEIDLKSGKTQFHAPSPDKNNVYMNEVLMDGNQPIVGNYAGCYRFNSSNDQFTPLFNTTASLPIIHLNFDHTGNLWMSSNEDRGIYIRHANDDSAIHYNQYSADFFYPHRNYSAWAELKYGRIALGYNRAPGLVLFNKSSDQFYIAPETDFLHFNEQINCLLATDSALWIGNNNGLTSLNMFNGKRNHYSRINGLPANSVNALAADPQGFVWIGSGNGVSRLDPKTSALLHFPLAGIASNHAISFLKYNPITHWMDAVTEFSYFSFRLPSAEDLTLKHAPSILVCSLDGKNIDIEQAYISMSESDRMLVVEFSCPSNPALQGVKYEFKLEGLDHEWMPAGERQQITYSVLPDGNFRLLIRASLDGVRWIETVVPLRIEVRPLFYKRLGFLVGALMVIILLVLFIIQRRKRIQLKNQLAIQQVRNRIAADLHDDVASSLSSISILSEVALTKIHEQPERTKNILERIGENSRSLISDMSDMVWSVNPENDTPDSLGARMQDFAAHLLQEKGIVFHLNTPPADAWPPLSMQVRKNIFLIFKEALNNTLKHANCSEIWIDINFKDSQLNMLIRDNGKGFDDSKKNKGNGLKNMIARADQINGKLHISSTPRQGASLNLIVNLRSYA